MPGAGHLRTVGLHRSGGLKHSLRKQESEKEGNINIIDLLRSLPGAVAQGLIWGIMAIGVYLTYRILDVADLTVDGSFGTGGAGCVMCLLSGMNVWAALFIALLAGALAVIGIQMRMVSRARRNLQEMNGQLSELNRSLNEANVVKEKYIGYFMNRCALYINKLCAYRKDVSHKLRSGQIDRLKIPPKEQEREFDELYAEFDEAFLKLYPSFVEEFNELLRPEARYETTEGRRNTELRIFALMRLGLTNVNQIAEYLRGSLQTVYNYKSKIKSKAQPGIEHFEEEVRKLGQNTFASDSM